MDFNLPYLLDYAHPAVDDIAIFCIAALAGIMVSAEGQAFAATLLGDSRQGAKDRFHYNVFLHMSFLGTLSFLVAGFGWAKEMDIDSTKFKNHPKFFLIISRLSGPLANLLLANIAASINMLIGTWGYEDKVFSTFAVVNVTMAIYNLIMIPPLPGAALITAFFPDSERFANARKIFNKICPFLLIATFVVARLSGWDGISSVFNPIVLAVSKTILGL